MDDILHFFPDAEQDVSQLEEAFASLLAAGIQYVDDDEEIVSNPSEDELGKDEIKEIVDDSQDTTIDDLKHIDTDDTIGLY
jgi:RNA polymerase primary sigma factor